MPTIKDRKLAQLMNDESFIRWLKGEGSPKEKKEWDQWCSNNEYRKKVVRKAKKFINMPFQDWSHYIDIDKELEFKRFEGSLREYES